MIALVQTFLARFACGLTTWSRKLGVVSLSALMCVVASAPAMAQEGAAGQGLNGWWLFLGILTVLASGLYLQSTRRRSG